MKNWLYQHQIYDGDLTSLHVILGITPYKIIPHAVNHMILLAKYYVHIQKSSKKNILYNNFLNYYRHVLLLEREIYCLNNNLNVFNAVFNKMFQEVSA